MHDARPASQAASRSPEDDYLYWTGCAANYDARIAAVVKATTKVLRAAGLLSSRRRFSGTADDNKTGKQMRRAFTLAIATALSALSLPAHADITIGVINSLSGNFATFGERYRTGMQVALDEINAAGGIKGQKIALSVQDDRSEAQSALAAGEKLASQQDVPLVIGSYVVQK